MPPLTDAGLWSLFGSAFVSATLAPGGSEAVLAYLAAHGQHTPAALLGVATLGNTLGAITTWFLGYAAAMGWLRKHRLPESRALQQLARHGTPLLLLSWLPVVGDGFCLAAGWLRMRFLPSLAAIMVGKAARYGAVLWLIQ